MNPKIISYRGMTIAVFLLGYMILNNKAFALGCYGYGHDFVHYYGPHYESDYPVYIACGGEH